MSQVRRLLHQNRKLLETGRVISVDPASGASSNAAFAIFEGGKLITAQEIDFIKVRKKGPGARLRWLIKVLQHEKTDVLVVEQMRNTMPKVLHWAVGCIVGAIQHKVLIEMSSSVWKQYVLEGYEKSDLNDAISIGRAIFEELKRDD